MRNRRSRIVLKMVAVLIAVGIIVLGYFGYQFSLKMRSQRRRDAQQAQSGAVSQVVSGSETTSESDTELLPADSEAEEAEANTAKQEEVSRTEEMLSEQTKAANQANALVLKGLIAAAVPNVSNYAAAIRGDGTAGASRIICLDPEHQAVAMEQTEAIAPGSNTRTQKMTVGSQGAVTGRYEYEINLEVANKLKEELQRRGYTVVMTRETNDVMLSEKQRARLAYMSGADVLLHIGCGASDDETVKGVLVIEPTYDSPTLSNSMIAQSQTVANDILTTLTSQTGQNNLGLMAGDDMAGINWAEGNVVSVQIGYLTNLEEEQFLTSQAGQSQIVTGIANGLDAYFTGAGVSDAAAENATAEDAAAEDTAAEGTDS